mmetsp:Transcript_1392/g.1808  ORF Transcript_1392/g.1808 Transcript_1392/m.1808 type:complete len:230 (+) Transcript_1392:251-940(+)
MDTSIVEAWLQCSCEASKLEDLLLRLRTLCEEHLTHMFYYEEQVLTPVIAGRNFLSGSLVRTTAARETHSYIWRLRNEVNKSIYSTGRDRARRPFNECAQLAKMEKQWQCIVEHELSRTIVAQHGCRFALRRRLQSEFTFNSGSNFFELCGLQKNENSTRFVQGRRYAHFLGITICIFSTSQNTSYSVEFSAVVPDPEDEFKIASRIERLADALAPLLTEPIQPAAATY